RGLSVLARGVSIHAWGLRLRRAASCLRLSHAAFLSFQFFRHRRLPDWQISELNTQPAYTPVQRFKCGLSTALAWLGARVVRYSFLCMTLSFTTPRRFIPTLTESACSTWVLAAFGTVLGSAGGGSDFCIRFVVDCGSCQVASG